jgi:hypothetical protein
MDGVNGEGRWSEVKDGAARDGRDGGRMQYLRMRRRSGKIRRETLAYIDQRLDRYGESIKQRAEGSCAIRMIA